MCGICGIVSQNPIVDSNAVTRMMGLLYPRGPDGSGEFENPHISLAMRRLSIIDLNGGWQPLYNEDSSLVLIANGEIYNFIELRKSLEAKGHRFKTGSDCETILHLYEDYGPDCVKYLRGMFAFALWDVKKQRLMLARDRMGEKPLYLYEKDGLLVFASEMKALLGSGHINFELDPTAVNLYFYYHYVPEPRTPIKGVRKLAAAHTLIVDVKFWNKVENCYWRMEDAPPITGDPAAVIRAELDQISELVIRSDVPVGVALSGGLDSSAVAALASKKYPGTIHAFSVGYPGRPPSDERNDAKAFADYLGIPFHDVELTTKAMVSVFPDLVYWRDDPIADISGYGYYTVMKLAHDHKVPVVLQGQGGDELFWGYPWVKQGVTDSMQKQAVLNTAPEFVNYLKPELPKAISRQHLYQWIRTLGGIRDSWDKYCYYRESPEDRLVFYDNSPDFQDASKRMKDVCTNQMLSNVNGSSPYDLFTIPSPRENIDILITKLICETYLLENGVTQGDRLSMRSSVELRLPLLDYRLVETVVGLRKTSTDYQLPPKALFKAALKDVLPGWVMNRPKRGFAPPTLEWHRELFKSYGPLLADGYLVQANILKPEAARALADGAFPPGVNTPMSFKALVLEQWCRKMQKVSEA